MARLLLDCLDEETVLVDFDVDCDADIILGYDWLSAHDLNLTSTRRRRASRRPRPAHYLAPSAWARYRLSAVRPSGPLLLGAGRPLPRLPLWPWPRQAAWAEDILAGLADSGTTLADGTALLVGQIGQISFATDGPAFTLPADDGSPPEFGALAGEYADVLAGPPPGLPTDRGPAFEPHD